MQYDNTITPTRPRSSGEERYFTVEEANRTLVFVRKVVRDIVNQYATLMELREQRAEQALRAPAQKQAGELRSRIERTAEKLNQLHAELAEVGCELKDWSAGLVDFPALHQGRKVWLCWKLGESAISQWHELDAGFARRQPIGADFGEAPPPR